MLLEGYTRSNRRSAMSVGNVLVGVWCRPGFLLSEVSQEFLQRTTDNAETDLHLYTNASPDSARAVRVDFDPSVRPSSSPLQREVGAVYPRVIQYCICEAAATWARGTL